MGEKCLTCAGSGSVWTVLAGNTGQVQIRCHVCSGTGSLSQAGGDDLAEPSRRVVPALRLPVLKSMKAVLAFLALALMFGYLAFTDAFGAADGFGVSTGDRLYLGVCAGVCGLLGLVVLVAIMRRFRE